MIDDDKEHDDNEAKPEQPQLPPAAKAWEVKYGDDERMCKFAFGFPATLLYWEFQPKYCQVSSLDPPRWQRIWWRAVKGCPSLEESGQTAGCVDKLEIPDGGQCQIGFDDDGRLEWVTVRYAAGKLTWGWGDGDPEIPAWGKDSGWDCNVAALFGYKPPFGLTGGRRWDYHRLATERFEKREADLQAQWRAHAAEPPTELVSRPPSTSGRKHEIRFVGLACPACGSHDTWMSGGNLDCPDERGWGSEFCSSCDSWLQSMCDCHACSKYPRPDRPSQVDADDALWDCDVAGDHVAQA